MARSSQIATATGKVTITSQLPPASRIFGPILAGAATAVAIWDSGTRLTLEDMGIRVSEAVKRDTDSSLVHCCVALRLLLSTGLNRLSQYFQQIQ